MTEFTFTTQKREEKAKDLRKSGIIPAVIYGHDFENQNISLEETSFARLFREAGTSNLIELVLPDNKKEKTLIHDIQIHPVTGNIEHVDFFKVDMKEKIKTEIPLEFTGETVLVVDQEGSLLINKDALEIECLPSDLVDHINVDISVLTDFEQNIKVSDINVPKTIEVLDDPDEVIALVQPPRSEEELEALNEEVVEDVESIEVEQGKEEETAEGEEESEEKADKKDKSKE